MIQTIQDAIYPIVCNINTYLSNYILLFLLVGVGLFFTIRTKFVQIRCFGEGMKKVFGNFTMRGKRQTEGMTSFQALTTAIAAQVGTGNIVGASGAILTGGPGAIFWMWIIAFFGMATIYAEATLAQKTKQIGAHGLIKGGPVYYIRTAFKGNGGKFLAGFFSIAAILALGFMGAMVQSNSIGSTLQTAFNIPTWASGVVLILLCALVFLGKVYRLAAVVEKVVPIMALIFLVGAITVLVMRGKYVGDAFCMIFKYAFAPQCIIGGTFGTAIKVAITQGVKRGLFSNEAGMGSTPHAHAQAMVKRSHDQGVVAMIGVFIDTFVVLTLCALVIISTMYTSDGPLATGVIPDYITKGNLAQYAFGSVMGEKFGAIFVAVCLFFFAFSTILSWNLFGKINAIYLFGRKNERRCIVIYAFIAIVFTFIGTQVSNDLVWELTDMFNNFMVIPNVIALFALSGMVLMGLKEGLDYKKSLKENRLPNEQ